jgi:DNA-binding NarL/FixJ family response regulator
MTVTAVPDRVVVLYSHQLLGEGLARMLEAEPGLVVTTVSQGTIEALDEALACNPDVVVFEEGGPIAMLDVLRRSGASVVIDVDITSSTAWTLRRQALRSAPEEVLAAIRDALAGRTGVNQAEPVAAEA